MIGLLYDVHGNLPALEAVLDDAASVGVDRFLLGGDYAAFGAWPCETVDRLRELDAEWIRGNVDRWTVDPHDAPEPVKPALAWCREQLGSEVANDLAQMRPTRTHEEILYCHASPCSDLEAFLPEPDPGDEQLLDGVHARRVVFGHVHLQFRREGPNGIELVNPGSVGIPLDGDRRAAWAVARSDGTLDLRRVEYDSQAAADAIRDRLGSDGEVFARRIEQARLNGP